MGVCNSTQGDKTNNLVNKGDNFDFENYREVIRRSSLSGDNKIYEVKAKLWEIFENGKVKKKNLISKYLFFKPDGTFNTKVKSRATDEEYLIDGKLESSTGEISFTYKEKSKTIEKLFEGKLNVKEEGITCTGVIKERETDKKESKETTNTFLLDFSNTLWDVEYSSPFSKTQKTPNSFKLFLYYNNDIFSGISQDDKGFSVWTGLEKANNNVTIIQHCLNSNYKPTSDKGIFSYIGIIDKISFIIEGDVYSSDINDKLQFKMKKVGKLYKK